MRFGLSCSVVAAAIAMAGCFDGEVTVVVNVEDPSAISTYRLVIYEAPSKVEGDQFNCRDLSFGDIPGDVLDEAEVIDLEAGPGDSLALSDIPRGGDKLFFVEGLNASRASLVAGCTDVGEINEPTTVVIDTLERKSSQVSSNLLDENGALALVSVEVVGVDGLPAAADVRASLRGAGPNGSLYAETVEDATGADGQLRLPLSMAPNVTDLKFGPIEFKLRVAWAQTPLAPIFELLVPDPLVADVIGVNAQRSSARGGNDLLEVGRIGPQGALGIVVLATDEQPGPRSPTYAHRFHYNGTAIVLDERVQVGIDDINAINGSARTLGLVHQNVGDKIVAVWFDDAQPVGSQLRWTQFIGGASSELAAPYSGIPNKLAPLNDDCEDSVDSLLFAQSLSSRATLEAAAPNGAAVQDATVDLPSELINSELIAIGCVRDTSNQLQRTLVFDLEGGDGEINDFAPVFVALITDPSGAKANYASDLNGALGASTQATTATIGAFTSSGAGSIVLGESTDSGPATSRYLLQPVHSANSVTVELQGSDPTPSVVTQTAEGDINGDGITDVVSIIATGLTLNGISAAVHVSMAVPGSTERLRARLSNDIDLIGARLRVVDLDGDGTDDIVVSSADFLRVYLMGAR